MGSTAVQRAAPSVDGTIIKNLRPSPTFTSPRFLVTVIAQACFITRATSYRSAITFFGWCRPALSASVSASSQRLTTTHLAAVKWPLPVAYPQQLCLPAVILINETTAGKQASREAWASRLHRPTRSTQRRVGCFPKTDSSGRILKPPALTSRVGTTSSS